MALTDVNTDIKDNIPQDNVIDINLEGIQRTRFRINGDSTAIIELNLSDLNIVDRLEKGLEQLASEMSEISGLSEEDEDLSEKMAIADKKMREYVDYIFDYPVSSVCARHGTMYDPKNGKFRYEIIIDGLTKLYADNINSEYKKIQNRVSKHTDKYTAPNTKTRRKKPN